MEKLKKLTQVKFLKKMFNEALKSLFLKFFLDKKGSKKALKPFDTTDNFPVICCGIEYVAKATGPKNILIKYLSNTS